MVVSSLYAEQLLLLCKETGGSAIVVSESEDAGLFTWS